MSYKILSPLDFKKTRVIACATVIEEMLSYLPDGMTYEVLDFGLHLNPQNLKTRLQDAIDRNSIQFDTIILGYGLCSMAVIGLESHSCNLIIPKVDDCIAIFLGSGQVYYKQFNKQPGTYYLTKGWIEVSDTLLDEYQRIAEKYGTQKAEMVMNAMLKNYKRLVYIDTGREKQSQYRIYAEKVANFFKLRFEEVKGSNALIEKMIFGPWDDDFIVISPGQTIKYSDFKEPAGCKNE